MNAVQEFFEAIENSTLPSPSTEDGEDEKRSAFIVMTDEQDRQMSIQQYQEDLRSNHIVVTGTRLVGIPCKSHGLTSLNSVKEIVNMEGMSS